MKTSKLGKLLEFPCPFTFKVLGLAHPELVDSILLVIQRHAPGDYTPTVQPSSKGNYHSVSVTIQAIHAGQLELLYKELGELASVKMVL